MSCVLPHPEKQLLCSSCLCAGACDSASSGADISRGHVPHKAVAPVVVHVVKAGSLVPHSLCDPLVHVEEGVVRLLKLIQEMMRP